MRCTGKHRDLPLSEFDGLENGYPRGYLENLLNMTLKRDDLEES
jgi:hypothetical protein